MEEKQLDRDKRMAIFQFDFQFFLVKTTIFQKTIYFFSLFRFFELFGNFYKTDKQFSN